MFFLSPVHIFTLKPHNSKLIHNINCTNICGRNCADYDRSIAFLTLRFACWRSIFLNGRRYRFLRLPRCLPEDGIAIPVCSSSPYWRSSIHRRFFPYAFMIPVYRPGSDGWWQEFFPALSHQHRCFPMPPWSRNPGKSTFHYLPLKVQERHNSSCRISDKY